MISDNLKTTKIDLGTIRIKITNITSAHAVKGKVCYTDSENGSYYFEAASHSRQHQVNARCFGWHFACALQLIRARSWILRPTHISRKCSEHPEKSHTEVLDSENRSAPRLLRSAQSDSRILIASWILFPKLGGREPLIPFPPLE